MFPYTVKYTESEYDIQNNDKTPQECQNTFDFLDILKKSKKPQKLHFLFCIVYEFHNSYFVTFVNFIILRFLYIFLYFILHV